MGTKRGHMAAAREWAIEASPHERGTVYLTMKLAMRVTPEEAQRLISAAEGREWLRVSIDREDHDHA